VQFTIRRYHAADFSTLLAIDQSCFGAGIAYTAYELKTYILRRASFTFVAELPCADGGARTKPASRLNLSIIGFIVGERVQGLGHIITIDVREQARRNRVGSVLLKKAEEELRHWKCPLVRLETAVDNGTALSFYKQHGFTVVQTVPRYYSNGLDALLLEKNLLSPPSTS
jgi:ribosomal-protein-alanine N-acetyltransferase